ncbi:MAG: 2-C-methyl-D-erythritol 4-phosphate cytidylyltransferase [Flavobacteriales bacterium]|nr:2-C-methyl-D-erythritol 4-phosphate cytidylyltransferase [Flavobacteriales bacterium]|tara:strand:+ start:230 stop:883 length:654 start_codon:yes stop_codon:yes gene_type:complete
MKNVALIVAGGKGIRMNSAIPKQFLKLKNLPILMHTLNNFQDFNDVFLVLPKSQFNYWKKLCKIHNFQVKHTLIAGGINRFESVKNGLKKINAGDVVAIHDGVRPYISKKLITALLSEVKNNYGTIPVLPIKESLREITNKYSVAVNREKIYLVQTPQCFKLQEIKKAYDGQNFLKEFTDDASVYEQYGGRIKTINGEEKNIKITSKTDLIIAESLD